MFGKFDSGAVCDNACSEKDYSSYIRSLDSYCRQWGYVMPEVSGSDHHSAYSAWSGIYSQWAGSRSNSQAAETDPYYDFVPIAFSDGSLIFYDQAGHGEVDALRMPDNHYRLAGHKSMVTAIGGRGEFDTIVRHLSDNNYFNDDKAK